MRPRILANSVIFMMSYNANEAPAVDMASPGIGGQNARLHANLYR